MQYKWRVFENGKCSLKVFLFCWILWKIKYLFKENIYYFTCFKSLRMSSVFVAIII
uniref:Macaca fascicularis brain cDNA clone: QmoA-10945, similar to human progesterone receptor membrane component 2 (PGRMC2), mRNA, RefSeq: NM_006320.1 n=1 Tax=Macaca fascicularis TaxID=9541 RepID=I7G8B2_MACFA|nr:unnamed protein product [Macaca fascicularis]